MDKLNMEFIVSNMGLQHTVNYQTRPITPNNITITITFLNIHIS